MIEDTELPEMKAAVVLHCQEIEPLPVLERFSSFNKLQRVMVLVLRFPANCRRPKVDRELGEINATEMVDGLKSIV